MPRRLLVGVAETSGTGEADEPRDYLLDLLRGLSSIGIEIQVALFEDAPIRLELETVADVRVMTKLRHRSPAGIWHSIVRRLDREHGDQRMFEKRTKADRDWIKAPDCIHLNAPAAAPLLRYVPDPEIPVTTYVHPLDPSVPSLPWSVRDRLLERTDRFLIANGSVTAELLALDIDEARIERAPYPLRFPPLHLPASLRGGERADARALLGLPNDRVVIGIPPVPDWVDQPDLTLAMAWEVNRTYAGPPPAFVWYGMPSDGEERWPLDYDIERMGVNNVHLIGDLPDIELYDVFDLIVLPTHSADDMPPTLVTEAADQNTPVLCWDGHPLAADVQRWLDGVVERPDVAAMAAKVIRYLDEGERLQVGQRRWLAELADIERIAPLSVPAP